MSSASLPQSPEAFPYFQNGDVQIVLAPGEKLRLHSDVLRNASDRLTMLLTTDAAAVLGKKALAHNTHVRYRLELVDVSMTLGGSPGRLQIISLDTHGHPIRTSDQARPSMSLSSLGTDPALRPIIAAWKSVFGTMYGQEIHIQQDGDDDLFGIIQSASTILGIVDHLELRNNVLAPLELALLSNEQMLWQSVSRAPIVWTGLGSQLRSAPIWKEAILHVVGGWKEWTREDKEALKKDVRMFVEKKVEELEDFKESLEQKLLDYRHEKLRFEVGKDHGKGKKLQEPDIFFWQAQWLWTDWLARRFREGMGWKARDGGWTLYKMISEGEWADPMEQRKVSPLTSSGMKVVDEIIRDMKEELKTMVSWVMTSRLKLHQGQRAVQRLTPYNIDDRNVPWKSKEMSNHRNKRQRFEVELHISDESDDCLE